jgi:hypothetical protein
MGLEGIVAKHRDKRIGRGARRIGSRSRTPTPGEPANRGIIGRAASSRPALEAFSAAGFWSRGAGREHLDGYAYATLTTNTRSDSNVVAPSELPPPRKINEGFGRLAPARAWPAPLGN